MPERLICRLLDGIWCSLNATTLKLNGLECVGSTARGVTILAHLSFPCPREEIRPLRVAAESDMENKSV